MFELDLKNTILRSILKFHNDRLTTQVTVITRLQKWFFGYSLGPDYWIVSMFELDLKNTIIRSILKFQNDRLTLVDNYSSYRDYKAKKWVFGYSVVTDYCIVMFETSRVQLYVAY
jgi:hypothetical protein